MRLELDAAPDELVVFLEEAEEQLQLLDQNVLALEKEGPNPDLLQELFRAAHTLKGSSATIGHSRMASLTHALESILDSLRKGRLEVGTDLINLLLESLDALRTLKEEVVSRDHSGLDPGSLVESLEQFLGDNARNREQPPWQAEAEQISVEAVDEKPAENEQERLISVTVRVDKECPFPAARFYQVHMSLGQVSTISASEPSIDQIETGMVGSEMRVMCETAQSHESIRNLIASVPDIVAVRIETPMAEGDGAGERDILVFDRLPQNDGAAAEARPLGAGRKAKDKISPERGASDGNAAASKTVRIDVERLDALMNLAGELVIDSTKLVQNSNRLRDLHEGEEIAQSIRETSLHVQKITDELQDRIMRARMFPVSSVFRRFPRMVRDLAQKAGKKIEFVIEGEETELDRSVIEEIGDPLIHLLRNAVDHGIEPPEQRVADGKTEVGLVQLTACHRENRIILTVEDDGKGIDPNQLKRAAVERGLLTAEVAARMSDREALEIIFLPGFSTAGKVSDVSGRGVGMDIVRTNIGKLNGVISVESSVGLGSRFTLELPLTLAIMDALLVGLDTSTFAIPLASITETLRVHPSDLRFVNGHKMIQLRGRVLPLLSLRSALQLACSGVDSDDAYVVVAGNGNEQVGIMVDSLMGEQQVVVKSLGKYIGDVRGLSGATILGDGRVALILDVHALVSKVTHERLGEIARV